MSSVWYLAAVIFLFANGQSPQGVTVMNAVVPFINRIVREEEGQDMVEYALLVGLISIVCVVALRASGVAINTLWEKIQGILEGI